MIYIYNYIYTLYIMYIMYIFEIMIPTKSKSVGESRTRAVLWSGCGSSGNHPDANRGGRRIRSV